MKYNINLLLLSALHLNCIYMPRCTSPGLIVNRWVKKQWTDKTEQYASTQECIKWNKKEGTFTQGFKGWRKIEWKVSQNLNDLQNLLINLTVKASTEKVWLLN